jgi:hypothetical protein
MRALWSRATQLPGTCRCISCVSKSTALARSRGIKGLPGSWALGTPTSTFLYTTVFAAGLTIDAKIKLDRNKQWDNAFEQLNRALNGPSEKVANAHNEKEPGYTTQSRGPSDVDSKESKADMGKKAASAKTRDGPVLRENDLLRSDDAAPIWDALRFDSRMPGAQALAWPANTGPGLKPHNLPPQSLWAPDVLRWTALRRRHTRKKLSMQELTVGLMVHKMIRHVDLGRFLKTASGPLRDLSPHVQDVASLTDDRSETVVTHFLSDLERLHQVSVSSLAEDIDKARVEVSHGWVPSYMQDADGDFYDICTQMNNSIAQLFRHSRKDSDRHKALAVAKICHNLLVSTAAPDLQTFNLLLSGFIRWNHPKLVDGVISAFYSAKIRPNEFLCKQILDHYTSQSRPDDFSRFVAKMRGVDDALSLADPAITVNEASEGRLIRIDTDKVYQKVHPTPMVFGSLIIGVLKFAGFDRALDVYYEMKADGWGLAMPELTKLLADCIRRADWEGGTYVWEEINGIKANVEPSYAARAYHHMLSLCSVTGNTVAFNQVLNEVAKRNFDQRAIIKSAMKTTTWAQHKKDNMAPAWAADNLMIAVSGYVHDLKSPKDTCGVSTLDDVDYDESLSAEHLADSSSSRLNEELPTDPKEAWSKWVEHEFGDKPKDPKP